MIAALLIGVAAVTLFWPGVAMFDTVTQFRQVMSGQYDDWHPPAMARLWAMLHAMVGGTAAPMLLFQTALYAVAFGLIAGALAATGRGQAAAAVLIVAASPLLLGWQMVILKDAQLNGALLAATGIVAAFHLRNRALPVGAIATVACLMIYATLVRGNAVFATAPLLILLIPRPVGPRARGGMVAAVVIAVMLVTPTINHELLGAEATGVAKSQAIFDLAGIAVRSAPQPHDAFTGIERTQIIAQHCSKPFFWDPLGDERACGRVTARLREQDGPALTMLLARSVAAHPLAYVRHRLAHWNMTERWAVPDGLIGAAPPAVSEPNDLGLISPPNPLADRWAAIAGQEARTPLGWPIVWTLAALAAVWTAFGRRTEPTGRLALALAGSAIGLEASFLLISIASDLRYHLWSMSAAALAIILLLDGRGSEPRLIVATLTGLTGIVAVGLVARATLPVAPATYRAVIDARTG